MKPIQAVEVELDKPRRMRLTMGALFHAERKINLLRGNNPPVSIFNLINREVAQRGETDFNIPADLMLVLFWSALLHEEPALSFEEAGDLAVEPLLILGKVIETLKLCIFSQPAAVDEDQAGGGGPLAQPNGSRPSHSDESSSH